MCEIAVWVLGGPAEKVGGLVFLMVLVSMKLECDVYELDVGAPVFLGYGSDGILSTTWTVVAGCSYVSCLSHGDWFLQCR